MFKLLWLFFLFPSGFSTRSYSYQTENVCDLSSLEYNHHFGTCATDIAYNYIGVFSPSPNPFSDDIEYLVCHQVDHATTMDYFLHTDDTTVFYALDSGSLATSSMVLDSKSYGAAHTCINNFSYPISSFELMEYDSPVFAAIINKKRDKLRLVVSSPVYYLTKSVYNKLSPFLSAYVRKCELKSVSSWLSVTALTDDAGVMVSKYSIPYDCQGYDYLSSFQLHQTVAGNGYAGFSLLSEEEFRWLLQYNVYDKITHASTVSELMNISSLGTDPIGPKIISRLLHYFRGFDVYLFHDTGMELHDITHVKNMRSNSPQYQAVSMDIFRILVQIAWIVECKTVLYLDLTSSLRVRALANLPIDGFIFDSSKQLRVDAMPQILLGAVLSTSPWIILPPVLPDNLLRRQTNAHNVFHFVFAGGVKAYSCPGAFVKFVGMMYKYRQDCIAMNTGNVVDCFFDSVGVSVSTEGYNNIEFVAYHQLANSFVLNDTIYVSFTMYGNGHLLHVMQQYVESLNISHCVGILIDRASDERGLLQVLSTATYVVDPCAITSGNAFVYPIAASMGIPVLRFKSSYSNEWWCNRLDDDSIEYMIEETSINALVHRVLKLMSNRLDGTARNSTEGLSFANRMFVEGFFSQNNAISRVEQLLLNMFNTSFDNMKILSGGSYDWKNSAVMPRYIAKKPVNNASERYAFTSVENEGVSESSTCSVNKSLVANIEKFHERWRSGCSCRTNESMNHHTAQCKDEATSSSVVTLDEVELSLTQHIEVNTYADVSSLGGLFCGIYSLYRSNHINWVKAQISTWGKRCDGYMVFADQTDWDLNFYGPLSGGNEHYQNMWSKVKSIWKFIARELINEYEWFLLGGDDLYIIVENLRMYLQEVVVSGCGNAVVNSARCKDPLYIGRPLRSSRNLIYNTGGSGYVLNKAALLVLNKLLVTDEGVSSCFEGVTGSREDVMIGYCLGTVGVFPVEFSDVDGEVFHWDSPKTVFEGSQLYNVEGYEAKYTHVKHGLQCCSKESISFQNMESPEKMRAFHDVLYKLL